MVLSKKRTNVDVPIEHDGASVPRPEAAAELNAQRRKDSFSVLVMGRSGSRKTQLVRSVCQCCEAYRSGNAMANQELSTPVSHNFILSNGSILNLIDTPGLDSMNMSDLDVFVKVAEYLRDPARNDEGITRIIYIHPAGDAFLGRAPQQNLKTIMDLFVNKNERPRLTVLVVPTGTQGADPQSVIEEIRRSNSGIFKDAARKGAVIKAAPPHPEGFTALLRDYALQPSVLPPICVLQCDARHPNIESWIEESLGYCDKRSVDSRILSYEKELESCRKGIYDLQASATTFRESYERLKHQHADQQKTEASLRQQLQEVKNDYGFLRSQVQAQDNHDQEGIAEGLVNLNKDIEDIGQSIAEHIVDNWVESAFGQHPSKISASNALDLAQLKSKLGHCDGKASLVESLDGKSLGVEEFFDFATRTLLCAFLSEKIFRPFHPHLDLASRELRGLHNGFTECYMDVRRHEPQYMSGKWRSIAFRGVGNMKRKASQPKIDAENLTQEFLNKELYPLLGAFFGQKHSDFSLGKQQSSRLHRLIHSALEWNSKLKGEVISLGDYIQTTYSSGTEYSAEFMQELEVGSNINTDQHQPTYILGTLALGLICWRATGQGRPPIKTVLEKALVATESLYV